MGGREREAARGLGVGGRGRRGARCGGLSREVVENSIMEEQISSPNPIVFLHLIPPFFADAERASTYFAELAPSSSWPDKVGGRYVLQCHRRSRVKRQKVSNELRSESGDPRWLSRRRPKGTEPAKRACEGACPGA